MKKYELSKQKIHYSYAVKSVSCLQMKLDKRIGNHLMINWQILLFTLTKVWHLLIL